MGDFTEEETANLGGSRSANKPEDPTGQFPADNHLNKENINTQARGETRNSLKWAASSEGVSQHVNKRYISSLVNITIPIIEYPKDIVNFMSNSHTKRASMQHVQMTPITS